MTDPIDAPGRRAYAEFAQRYADIAPTKPHNALYERPATLALLGDVAGQTVLDAGCGPGICSELLARRADASLSAPARRSACRGTPRCP
ncbi:hypothetical protein WJ86_13600 [Burkholderia multivorans]|nr:hypothetical protein WJ86_13600 [Burkholderia multivorans]